MSDDRYNGKRVSTLVSYETYDELTKLAKKEKRTISKMVDTLICEAIDNRKNKDKNT